MQLAYFFSTGPSNAAASALPFSQPSKLPGVVSKSQPVPLTNDVAPAAVDMSGLSEEEKRQIALVMERAAQMMEQNENEPSKR